MSGYLPQIRYETEFQGDKVVIELKPLGRKAFVQALPALEEAKNSSDSETKKLGAYEVACEVLDEHITEVTGLRDKNGNAVNKETMLNVVYFMMLVLGAFNKLIQESELGKLKSANLEVKLPESTEAGA